MTLSTKVHLSVCNFAFTIESWRPLRSRPSRGMRELASCAADQDKTFPRGINAVASPLTSGRARHWHCRDNGPVEIGIEIEISLGLRNPGPVPAPPPARSRTLLPACPTFIQITPPPPDMEAVFDNIRNGEYYYAPSSVCGELSTIKIL